MQRVQRLSTTHPATFSTHRLRLAPDASEMQGHMQLPSVLLQFQQLLQPLLHSQCVVLQLVPSWFHPHATVCRTYQGCCSNQSLSNACKSSESACMLADSSGSKYCITSSLTPWAEVGYPYEISLMPCGPGFITVLLLPLQGCFVI